jgi:hypothetical protein
MDMLLPFVRSNGEERIAVLRAPLWTLTCNYCSAEMLARVCLRRRMFKFSLRSVAMADDEAFIVATRGCSTFTIWAYFVTLRCE